MINDLNGGGFPGGSPFHFPFKSQRDLDAFDDAEAYYFFGRSREELSFEEKNALLIMYQMIELTECPPEKPAECLFLLHAVAAMLSAEDDPEGRKRQHDVFRELFLRGDWLNSEEGHAALRDLLAKYPASAKSHFSRSREFLEYSYQLFAEQASADPI